MDYTLITGGSGHLGIAFAKELVHTPLILTGRSMEKLEKAREELLQINPNADLLLFACDLTNEGDRYALMQSLRERDIRLSMLINVAGADVQKAFSLYTQEKIAFQCRVNFEAAVSLCHFALERRGESLQIINISSVSGIYPMPYFAIYSAMKGALTSFSCALRKELKKEGVKVTAILPGAMPTREDIKRQIEGQGLWGKMAAKSPSFVAKKSLRAARKNRAKYIPGFCNKCMNVCTKIIPLSWKMHFIAKRWSKISKDAF